MPSVTKQFRFEAAHHIPNHPGKCKRLHGHSYMVEVTVIGDTNEETGMVIDFDDLKAAVGPVIEQYDHRNLNDIFLPLTTAENIARSFHSEVAEELEERFPKWAIKVRVYETPTSWAEYP